MDITKNFSKTVSSDSANLPAASSKGGTKPPIKDLLLSVGGPGKLKSGKSGNFAPKTAAAPMIPPLTADLDQRHEQLIAKYEKGEIAFSRESVVSAVRKWTKSLNQNPNQKFTLLPAQEYGSNFGKIRVRNLTRSRKYGAIANVCGVCFDVLWEMENDDQTPKREQYRLICLALLINNWLTLEDAEPPQVVGLAPSSDHADLEGQLGELFTAAARWHGSDKLLPGIADDRLEVGHECDGLIAAAQIAGKFDIADLATILKGCFRIKASLAASFVKNDSLIGKLNDIRCRSGNRAIAEVAAWTQARLMLELTLLIGDQAIRVEKLRFVAEIMGSVQGGGQLRHPMPIPGLASEADRTGLFWPAGQDPMTSLVPEPYRYKSALFLDAFFQAYLADPHGIDNIRHLLARAERYAETGLEKFMDWDQPRWNLLGTRLAVNAMKHIILTGDNGHKPGTQLERASRLKAALEIDDLISGLTESRSVAIGKRTLFHSTMLTWKIFYAYDGGDREKHLADDVLPLVVETYRRLPLVKSMSPQEFVFQHSFMRNADLGAELLKACGYTEAERRKFLVLIRTVQAA